MVDASALHVFPRLDGCEILLILPAAKHADRILSTSAFISPGHAARGIGSIG